MLTFFVENPKAVGLMWWPKVTLFCLRIVWLNGLVDGLGMPKLGVFMKSIVVRKMFVGNLVYDCELLHTF